MSPRFANTCMPTPYNGSICVDYLRSYQRCLPNSGAVTISSGVYVPETVDQESNEDTLRKLDDIPLEVFGATPECVSALKPFVCLFYFGLCDEATNKTVRPSFKQCRKLKSATCKDLVNNIRRADKGYLLPDCRDLPDSSPIATCGT